MILLDELKLFDKYQVLDKIKSENKERFMYLKEIVNYLEKKKRYRDDHVDYDSESDSEIDFDDVIIVARIIKQKNKTSTNINNVFERIWMSLHYAESYHNCKNPFYFDYKIDNYLHLTTTATGNTLYESDCYKIDKSHILIQENSLVGLEINILFNISELYNLLFPPYISRKYRSDINIVCSNN